MKLLFRKTEYYTVYAAGPSVELDSNDFPEFNGETEEEFLDYIKENLYEFSESDEVDGVSEDSLNKLWELNNGKMTEYANSKSEFFQGDLQIGEVNPDYIKTGGFKVNAQTSLD